MPTEVARGYIMHAGHKIGRIATQAQLMVDPSVHVACFCSKHTACQRWITLSSIPDTRRVRMWMAHAADYKDTDAHWQAICLAAHALSCICVRGAVSFACDSAKILLSPLNNHNNVRCSTSS